MIYPAPIITVTKNRFTKHYFIGSKRIASKIGTGRFSNVYGIGGNNITAGQKDYAARMMQIEKQREEYYKQLGTPPGVPTMKGATADPDNTGIGYNSIITDLGDHSVPEGWIQHPKFNGKGDVPGPPIQWSEPESPDNALPTPPTPRKSSGKPTIEGISTRNAEYFGWRLGNNICLLILSLGFS